MCVVFFFFKQKTAYEMRISDWSSDVCSSDLRRGEGDLRNAVEDDGEGFEDPRQPARPPKTQADGGTAAHAQRKAEDLLVERHLEVGEQFAARQRLNEEGPDAGRLAGCPGVDPVGPHRSEEHTSELQSLMRISYAVFCLKKKKIQQTQSNTKQCKRYTE